MNFGDILHCKNFNKQIRIQFPSYLEVANQEIFTSRQTLHRAWKRQTKQETATQIVWVAEILKIERCYAQWLNYLDYSTEEICIVNFSPWGIIPQDQGLVPMVPRYASFLYSAANELEWLHSHKSKGKKDVNCTVHPVSSRRTTTQVHGVSRSLAGSGSPV